MFLPEQCQTSHVHPGDYPLCYVFLLGSWRNWEYPAHICSKLPGQRKTLKWVILHIFLYLIFCHTMALVSWPRHMVLLLQSKLGSGYFMEMPAECSFCSRNSSTACLETSEDRLDICGTIENNRFFFHYMLLNSYLILEINSQLSSSLWSDEIWAIFNLQGWMSGTENNFCLIWSERENLHKW